MNGNMKLNNRITKSKVRRSSERNKFASASITKEYTLIDEKIEMEVLENKESIQHVEKAVGDVELKEQNFPDPVFIEYLSNNYDSDNDGILSSDEINKLTRIYLYGKGYIKSLKGIEYFLNLTELNCYRTGITNIDVSKNLALENLYCDNTNITSLGVSNNTDLICLYIRYTNLAWLSIGSNPNIT